jgi:hypothetical protein
VDLLRRYIFVDTLDSLQKPYQLHEAARPLDHIVNLCKQVQASPEAPGEWPAFPRDISIEVIEDYPLMPEEEASASPPRPIAASAVSATPLSASKHRL